MATAYRETDAQTDFFRAANDNGARRDEALPVWLDGSWGKAETRVFVTHLKRGELSEAMEVVGSLSNDGARAVLCEAGFVPQALGGRQAMLESVQYDLIRAARGKMTGVELRAAEGAARPVERAERVFPGDLAAPAFSRALGMLQNVLSAQEVEVGVAGVSELGNRTSLQFIAGQAVERGISGFAIDGIDGKFRLPDSVHLADLRNVYGAAGAAVALAEVKAAFAGWAAGKMASHVSDLVAEPVVKVLRNTASVAGAEMLRGALTDGTIAEFGSATGIRLAGQVLAKQGVRIDAPPVEETIADNELRVITPDTKRGQYVGPVVLQDHRASVIKCGRNGAVVVAHKAMGGTKPKKGDMLVVKFKADQMEVNVQRRDLKQGIGR